MRVIKHLVTGIILLLTASCIDPYHPQLKESQELLVVNGMVTDVPGEYTVEISRSVPFDEPVFLPVRHCVVEVTDNLGSTVAYTETSPGIYTAYLDSDFLGTGRAYQLYVKTPDEREYFSEYDSLIACPRIDKLYYELERRGGEEPGTFINGLQFFVDVKGSSKESGNFLWKLEETWEYTASYTIQYIWDGTELKSFYPIDSLYYCYKTLPVREVYAASTRYLTQNELIKYPLVYVSDESNRLWMTYSLLVEQYSLSSDAYFYWDKLKKQISGQGGLYEIQPFTSEGNIYNPDDPDELVLGFFYASQIKRTRIMVDKPFDYKRTLCRLDTIPDESGLPDDLAYLISVDEEDEVGPPYGWAPIDCFDCRLNGGGTIIPPDYWDIVE